MATLTEPQRRALNCPCRCHTTAAHNEIIAGILHSEHDTMRWPYVELCDSCREMRDAMDKLTRQTEESNE